MQLEFDVLVTGSGIAGLYYSLRVADHCRVAVVTKKQAADSATNRAQGGIAAVLSSGDSFDSHIHDTLVAGDGLCDETVVQHVVERGPAMIAALREFGTEFDLHRNPADQTPSVHLRIASGDPS